MGKIIWRLGMLTAAIIIFIIIVLVIKITGNVTISKILPPRPIVVSSNVIPKTKHLDFSYTIWTVVRNDGGNGDVVVEITYSESGRSWMKSARRNFYANETATITMEFPEATLFGKNRNYRINVR